MSTLTISWCYLLRLLLQQLNIHYNEPKIAETMGGIMVGA